MQRKAYNYIINLANQFIVNKNIVKVINDTIIENEHFKISANVYDFEKYLSILMSNFKERNNMIKINLKDYLDLFFNIVYQKNLFLIIDKQENKYYLASIRLSKEILNSPTTIIIYIFKFNDKFVDINKFASLFDLLNIKIGQMENEFSIIDNNNVKCNIRNKNFIVGLKALLVIRKNSVINDRKNKPIKDNTIVYEINENDYEKYFDFYYDIKNDKIIFPAELYVSVNKGIISIPKIKDGFYIEDNIEIKIESNYSILFDINDINAYSLIKKTNLQLYLNDFINENIEQINNYYNVYEHIKNKKADKFNIAMYKNSITESLRNKLYYIFYELINGYRTFYFSNKNMLYLISINIFDKIYANYNKNWRSCLYNNSSNLSYFIEYHVNSKIPIIFYVIDINSLFRNYELRNINDILSNIHRYGHAFIIRGVIFFQIVSLDNKNNTKIPKFYIGGLYKSNNVHYKIIDDNIKDIYKFLTKSLIYLFYKHDIINYEKFVEMIKNEDEIMKNNPIKKTQIKYKFGNAEGYLDYEIQYKNFANEFSEFLKIIKNKNTRFRKKINDFILAKNDKINEIIIDFCKIFENIRNAILNNEDEYNNNYEL